MDVLSDRNYHRSALPLSERSGERMQGFYLTEIPRNYPEILSEILSLRMIRKKLNRGGDGDAHHRSTSDGGRHDKRVCQC